MHFGIYHNSYEINAEAFDEMAVSDYVSFFLVGADYRSDKIQYAISKAHRHGKRIYIYFFPLVFDRFAKTKMVDVGEEYVAVTVKKPDWQKALIEMRDYLSGQDYYESIEGLYLDEPLLGGMNLDDLEEVTGFIRQEFEGKRIFVCFSVAGVAPDIWTTGDIKPITAKAGQYLTDVAFDMYHDFDEKYEYITNQMKERLGNREDLRIWQVPCTMNYRGDKDEAYAIRHLQGCYELLKKEKNPGGLFCYTYYTFPSEVEDLGNIGLDKLRGFNGSTDWKKLYVEIIRIGKECITNNFGGKR